MEKTIKPFGNNILVEPTAKKQILVSDRKSLCEYGKVIAIGKDVKEIKIGDTIGYLVWGISSLEIGNKTHYFVPESAEFLLGTIHE
jgi:co-chaperonin GroES (HSP10)